MTTRAGALSRCALYATCVVALVAAFASSGVLRAAEDAPETIEIAGIVTGRGAGPLELVSVVARRTDGRRVPHGVVISAVTDDEGRFRLAGLPRAEYRLDAGFSGEAVTRFEPFTAAEGKTRVEASLELDVGGVIRGRVVAADGGGVPGVVVTAMAQDAPGNSSLTNVAGEFLLRRLARGATYRVETGALPRAPGDLGPMRTTRRDGVPADGPAVTLDADVGAALDGVVVDPDGRPLPNCAIACAPRADEVPGVAPTLLGAPVVTTTDRRGRFRAVCVPPGRYRLGVIALERGPANVRTTGGDDVPAGTRGLRLVVDPAGSVRGMVVDEGGAPVVAGVRATPGDPSVPIRIDGCARDGRFEVKGLDARWGYTLTVCAPGRCPVTLEYVNVGRDDLRIVLRRGLSVSGRVTFADGRPGAGLPLVIAPIGAEGTGWGGMQEATTDADGRFTATGFAPGAVRVAVDLSASASSTRTHGAADATAGADDVSVVVTEVATR